MEPSHTERERERERERARGREGVFLSQGSGYNPHTCILLLI